MKNRTNGRLETSVEMITKLDIVVKTIESEKQKKKQNKRADY